MKKYVLVLLLLATSFAARAQFEAGKFVINPSLTNLEYSYSKDDRSKIGFDGHAGYFIYDNISLMARVGASWSSPVDEYTLGGGARYYFDAVGIYIGTGLDINRLRYTSGKGKSHTDWGLGIETGYAFFISRTVTIEPSLYYKWRFNDGDKSKFGVKFGFGFYF